MFDTTLLQHGKRYKFRGKILTYCYATDGIKSKRFVFKTEKGATREICQAIVQTELWELRDESEATAPTTAP